MADRTLKVVDAPQAKSSPDAPADQAAKSSDKRGPFARMDRARLRKLLLIGIPALALVIGAGIYLAGGRYISTDNAYVGAQKVLVTPDVSGKVIKVLVREGQHVKPGDELFELDPQPFRLALSQAEAKLADARIQYDNLKTNLASLTDLTQLAKKNVDLKKADVDRKMELLQNRTGDITYLRIGQKVEIDVDSFPAHTFRGTVQSVSPGTGSQFSILPAQNASGNWVKVVQRVPVRIVFDKSEDVSRLRSGMSATVSIDTGHSRLPFVANATPAEK